MRLTFKPVRRPFTLPPPTTYVPFRCCTITQPPPNLFNDNNNNVKKLTMDNHHHQLETNFWEGLLDPVDRVSTSTTSTGLGNGSTRLSTRSVNRLGKRWKEYQGIKNWEGLLDPLDDNLRGEILRYGQFVDAAYKAFNFDPSSTSYATCQFPRSSLFDRSGLPETGYRISKNLRATSGIQLPRWIEKAPSWMSIQSSWIGYVAVCQNKDEIARLGRRDVVIAFRGTATCLEWLENLRATLTELPNAERAASPDDCGPMVESGFLSLYTSGTANCPSLQNMIRQEITRILQSYGDEPLSLTITGHSLGAALATLTAYDIMTTFKKRSPLVTVISFGGPRVGNGSFRHHLEKQGTKVLRIVNSDDLITKVPGFVIEGGGQNEAVAASTASGGDMTVRLSTWIQKRMEETRTQWVYAEVGKELRLSSRDSPYLKSVNVATCHELKTYLHLVDGFVSSTCPFRATARRMLNSQWREKLRV